MTARRSVTDRSRRMLLLAAVVVLAACLPPAEDAAPPDVTPGTPFATSTGGGADPLGTATDADVGPSTADPSGDGLGADDPTDDGPTAERDDDVIDPPPPGSARFGEVERVVDGDTVVIELDGERERVRLLRIDTPELARDGDPAECLAEEAAAALEALLPPGEPVLVATDVEARDRFDRLLGHVWTRATWVNAQMLRDGYAQVVTFPPNTAYDAEVLAAQQRARDAGVGLWDPATCP